MYRSFWSSLALVVALLIVGVDASAVGAAYPDGTDTSWDWPGDVVALDSTDLTAPHLDASTGGQLLPAGAVAAGEAHTYEHRRDFARPPPSELASYTHEAPSNLADSVADGSRVRRVSSGLEVQRVAPSGAVRIGDDVITHADGAFTHRYSYHARIRARRVQDPVGHNFPYSYDDVILRSTPVRQAYSSLLYRTPGSIDGNGGFFEIAVNPDAGTIFHRTFVGG